MKVSRRRNAAPRCPICALSMTPCLCASMPRLDLRTRICLVIHHRELTRASNTGLLATRALVNSEIRVRGERRETLDLSDVLTTAYRTFVLYPAHDAVLLDDMLLESGTTPIQLIVPDGTWRQARKVHTRQPELRQLPRVRIPPPHERIHQLRAQSCPGRMATLPAIAQAIRVIEGPVVAAKLMALYRAKVELALSGRGILKVTTDAAGRGG